MTIILPKFLKFLSPKLTAEEQESLLAQLSARARPCLVLETDNVANMKISDSRVGGSACLGAADHPVDKSGKPMKFVAQLNMSQLDLTGIAAVKNGLLSVFVSDNYRNCQPKDSGWFRIIWQPSLTPAPDIVSTNSGARIVARREALFVDQLQFPDRNIQAEISQWIKARNVDALGESYLFADTHPRLEEAKAISAFSANGITYNVGRAKDACYSHLMEAAKDWRLLWRLRHENSDLLLMIHTHDINNQSLQKSWLVRY